MIRARTQQKLIIKVSLNHFHLSFIIMDCNIIQITKVLPVQYFPLLAMNKIPLITYFNISFNFNRKYLRETLKLANPEDLNRLSACSLVLLGHTFFTLRMSQVWGCCNDNNSNNNNNNLVISIVQIQFKVFNCSLRSISKRKLFLKKSKIIVKVKLQSMILILHKYIYVNYMNCTNLKLHRFHTVKIVIR